MYKLLKRTKYAALFFCALTVFMGVLPWLIHGMTENLSYTRHEGMVTLISDFSPSSNMFVDGKPVNIADSEYKYRLENGKVIKNEFTAYEWDNYAVGDKYVVYTQESMKWIMPESEARSRMTTNILFPIVLVIAALSALIAGAVKAEGIFAFCRIFPKSSIFSVSFAAYSGYMAVYSLFIYYGGSFLGGIAEFFERMLATAICVISVIAEIVIWCTAIHRKKKMIHTSEVKEGENEIHTG